MIVSFDNAKFEDGEVHIDEVSITYAQNGDCTEDSDIEQEIRFEARNNGSGRFVCFHTEGWSLNNADDFKELYDDFCRRAEIINEEK